jgi:hypothetical protein
MIYVIKALMTIAVMTHAAGVKQRPGGRQRLLREGIARPANSARRARGGRNDNSSRDSDGGFCFASANYCDF